MSKTHGMGDNAYVGGYNLSGDTQSLSRIAGGPAALDLTDITQSAFERQGGIRDGGIDWVSFFDKAAGGAHVALSPLPRTDTIVSYFHALAIGGAAASCQALQIGYDPTRSQDGSLTMAVATTSDGYGLEWGQALTVGVRTDTTATSPATGLDFGSTSTAFGLQAYLHVFAVTGTSVTVKLQDSADNSTFADITSAAFTAATGRTSQRIAVSGTVRRYVRAISTGTFSNAQFAVNFVRNESVTF